MIGKKSTVSSTPASLGFAMPAEWERHEATWLGWPHNPTDWPRKVSTIRWVYGEMVRKIVPGEIVRLFVNSRTGETAARRLLTQAHADASRVEFIIHPTNRGWTRDSGPICVRRGGNNPETAFVHFHFNAWAKYPDWQKDRKVPEIAAKRLGKRLFNAEYDGRDFVIEGGAIDVNGRGTLLTTEECLLDRRTQVRNPGLGRTEIESVLALESNPKDINYKPLAENRERLEGMRLEDGSKIHVVALPMPAPIFYDGYRLPASYANFYISNAAVLVPTFNDPNDRIALGILGDLFRDRPVVGIHAVDLVLGFGTVHCLSQQQPAV